MKKLPIVSALITLPIISFAQVIKRDTNTALVQVSDSVKKPTIIRICAPRRGQLIKPVLMVMYWRNQLLFDPDTSKLCNGIFGWLNPQTIKTINVLDSKRAVAQYGNIAVGGAVQVHLKDERKTRKQFKAALTKAQKSLDKQ